MHQRLFRTLSKLFLYRLWLRGKVPTHLPYVPHDPWPGDIIEGTRIIKGAININGKLVDISDLWSPELDENTYSELHSFNWLRDLRSVGDNSARKISRQLIQNWIIRNKNWGNAAWSPGTIGQRLSIWISLYDFFGSSADDSFRIKFLKSVARQYRHLHNALSVCCSTIDKLRALKGLIFAAATLFDDKTRLHQYLELLCDNLQRQIEPDGGHKSRRVDYQLTILRDLIDIRSLLKLIGEAVPKELQKSINLMAPMIRLFRHGDGGLAMFGSSWQSQPQVIDMALSIADVRGKAPNKANTSRFERCITKNSLLLANTGKPMAGVDEQSLSILNFEWSYGKERVIVRSDSFIGDNEPIVDPETLQQAVVKSNRQQADGNTLLDMTLDYNDDQHLLNFHRKLYLTGKTNELRGQDLLLFGIDTHSAQRFVFAADTEVEFHGNGSTIDIMLPSNLRWRLFTSGVEKLEIDTVLLPNKSKKPMPCIYLMSKHSSNEPATIKWAFHKAG